jgi:hypothetical protein
MNPDKTQKPPIHSTAKTGPPQAHTRCVVTLMETSYASMSRTFA